ncbi:hypothetical protein QVD17_27176 [Tagetes erecta]|uniref:Uncharacterized protein n=1 Tax=Tagetes erecta TaxID=13708 RepID=A0AAD8NQT9_TARER|nr:hypothetical protein QVD17_27176 [Tagetes erecta]
MQSHLHIQGLVKTILERRDRKDSKRKEKIPKKERNEINASSSSLHFISPKTLTSSLLHNCKQTNKH